MKKFGLIGHPLGHSYSKEYFRKKFEKERLHDHSYELFDLNKISDFPDLIHSESDLVGLNVTTPYKTTVIQYLDELDGVARDIRAVNVIRVYEDHLVGKNSDFHGFEQSLMPWLGSASKEINALVLGTGGASKAIVAVLKAHAMMYHQVSRYPAKADFTYLDLHEQPIILETHQLIINCTPVGMGDLEDQLPDIPYQFITSHHYMYDLIYNPSITKFLSMGKQRQAKTMNGEQMLHLQAEKAWEMWNA